MREQTLKDFFLDKVTIDTLSSELKDSQKKTGFDTTTVYVSQIKEVGEFKISIDHLILLCDAAIEGKLTMTDLNTIAFVLITSEHFTWDLESNIGNRIDTVIYDWDNTEIGFDLTIENVKLWKDYLLTGDYKFNFKTLKRKNR